MTEKKRLTLADVAAAAGVSKMTASRALRGAADVSRANLDKVQRAARDIGYVGNHLATSLSSKQSDLIGVVVPSLSNIVFAEVLSGIAQGLTGSGLQPVFGVTDYDPDTEQAVVRNLLSWRPKGLIVTGLDQPSDTVRLLRDAQIPIVQIMDTDGTPVDACVGFSHHTAGYEMAKTLIELGHRRFGYIGCGLEQDTRARKRLAGFQAALTEASLKLVVELQNTGPSTVQTGRKMTAQMLRETPELDCVYYSNDDLAAGGAFHCIAQGIAVPEALQLAGFNGLDLINSLPVDVATTSTPRREIGKSAVDIILQSATDDKLNRQITYSPVIQLNS